MVLHSRGCGRVARRRILLEGFPSSVTLREPPFFFIRSRPLFIRLPVLAPRGMQEFFISRHLCIAWSVGVTVINDVMSLTRYTRAGSRESRYDRKRQKPDD